MDVLQRDPSAQLLREGRIDAGLTQEQLADRVQMSTGAVASYESGRRPLTLPVLDRLLGACGLRLRSSVEGLAARAERGLAALEDTSLRERVPRSCVWLLDQCCTLDVRWGGGLAAVLQGAPVLPRRPSLAVTTSELRAFEAFTQQAVWQHPVDLLELRVRGRAMLHGMSGGRVDVVLHVDAPRERRAEVLFGPVRLVALEDLDPADVDEHARRGALAAPGLRGWPTEAPAPVTWARAADQSRVR